MSVVGSQARYIIEIVGLKNTLGQQTFQVVLMEDTPIFGVTTQQEVVHNLGGAHDAEQRSVISGQKYDGPNGGK